MATLPRVGAQAESAPPRRAAGGRVGASTPVQEAMPRRAPGPTRTLPSGWGVARRRLSRTMVVALALLTVASAGIVQVLQSSRVAEVGYTLRELEQTRETLDAQIRLLEARIAESSNLEHLREQAVTRLGMAPAEESMRIRVDTPAPQVVPLPRRYVQITEQTVPEPPSWWEELIGSLPGFSAPASVPAAR